MGALMSTLNNTKHAASAILGAELRGAAPQMKEMVSYMISLLPDLRREVSSENIKDYYYEGSRFNSDERVVRDALKKIDDPVEYTENPIFASLIPDILKETLISLAGTDYHYRFEKEW